MLCCADEQRCMWKKIIEGNFKCCSITAATLAKVCPFTVLHLASAELPGEEIRRGTGKGDSSCHTPEPSASTTIAAEDENAEIKTHFLFDSICFLFCIYFSKSELDSVTTAVPVSGCACEVAPHYNYNSSLLGAALLCLLFSNTCGVEQSWIGVFLFIFSIRQKCNGGGSDDLQ